MVNEKTKAFEDRQQLEREILVTCKEIADITPYMFVEEKVLQLGQLVADIRKENEELQAQVVPSTPPT